MKKILPSLVGLLLVVGGFAFAYYLYGYVEPRYTVTNVARGPVVEEVYAVGKVEPVADAYLFFKNTGKITSINVKVGDSVRIGDVLASQDTKDIKSQTVEIDADINVQRARIDQLKAGSSKEAVDVANTAVSNAVTTLSNAELAFKNTKQSTVDTLKTIFTTSDDIIKNSVDQMIRNPQTANPSLLFSVASNFSLKSDLEMQRVAVQSLLDKWEGRTSLISSNGNLFDEIDYSKTQLSAVKQFVDKFSQIVNNPVNKPSEIPQTTWDSWRNQIAQARSTLSTLSGTLTTAETSINNADAAVKVAKGALKTANEQLGVVTAGTRKTDLAVYEAQLAQAAAARSKIDAQKQDLSIISPLNGLVSEVSGKVGKLAGPDKTVITVLSLDDMQIKLNVVENNIIKIKVGQIVRVTFDAAPEKTFKGKITEIEPAETEINGTVYYKTTVLLDKNEDFIRSGMTANVWVTTNESTDALYVPVSALIRRDSRYFVKVLENKKPVEVEVEAGIRDARGNVEIRKGLSEGQQVIIDVPHENSF